VHLILLFHPFPPFFTPQMVTPLVGKKEQEQRWAALKERLGSEETRKALEEEVREGGKEGG